MERSGISAVASSRTMAYEKRWRQTTVQVAVFLASCCGWCWADTTGEVESASAGVVATTASSDIRIHRSEHFRIQSDLAEAAAHALLVRMESTLQRVSTYWRHPPRGTIEGFVVDDLSRWSMKDMPHPMVRLLLEHVGGITIPTARDNNGRSGNRAVIYATSRPNVVEHEVVHAYCCQTFGTCGPDWYKEGMAVLICLLPANDRSVRCPDEVVVSLQQTGAPTINEIITAPSFTTTLFQTLTRAASLVDVDDPAVLAALPTAWGVAEEDSLQRVKDAYARSWALCHFLALNKNYSKRFRQLGQDLLQGIDVDFEEVFAADRQRMAFEFEQFVINVDQGYQVDLCRWEWDKLFSTLVPGGRRSLLVQAAAGYQPTGCTVKQGEIYTFRADGTWQTAAGGKHVSADGANDGTGRLSGAILTDYQLSDEMELGQSGKFLAAASGQLYVRCRDRWNELHDNTGILRLQLGIGD